MKLKENKITNLCIIVLILMIVLASSIYFSKKEKTLGKIYFDKPASWEHVYAYLYDSNTQTTSEQISVSELKQEKDYIYSYEITNHMLKNLDNFTIVFHSDIANENPNQYRVEANFEGYNKIYHLQYGIGENNTNTIGEWLDYNENINIGKIPTTENKIKNVIYMIGDGMGENHILAGQLYKGQTLNLQKIKDKTYVKTASTSTVTDSAAAATALSSGYKTNNAVLGKDQYGNNVENIMEYSNAKGLKTGIVCTQILNHATPAGFSIHNEHRYNYEKIAESQTQSFIDIMLGGGRNYFSQYEQNMLNNNYKWINHLSELNKIAQNEKVIGTFANESISKENIRTPLADMVEAVIPRLENENGFILMIEGSDIDTYSHEGNMAKMLTELIDFDDAIKVAIEYVDTHPDTLLIVTADHETGGLNLDGVTSKQQLQDSLFTSYGAHTETNVLLYAYGNSANDLTKYDVIDNTSIYKFLKQGLSN